MNIKQILIGSTLLVALVLDASAQIKNADYKVDKEKSQLKWIGSKPAGQHHGTVQISDGTLRIEKETITSGTFTIDLNTIKDLDLTDSTWNQKLVGHLKSADFFYVEKFPTATFKITKASKIEKSKVTITGDLTIKGITNSITFDAIVSVFKGVFNATSSEIVLDRVKWDIKTMSKSVFADLKDKYVDDEMRITIELVANAK